MFLFFYAKSFCQVNDLNNATSLINEISRINTSESFLQFLIRHEPTFEDFDSLYTILHNKPCPKNFTYNLVNGDGNIKYKVSTPFLLLVLKNIIRQSFDIDFSKIKSFEEFTQHKPFKDPYNSLRNSYYIINDQIKYKFSFKIGSIEAQQIILYCDTSEYINADNNIQSWIKQLQIDRETIDKSFYDITNFKNRNKSNVSHNLEILWINPTNIEWENDFWHQIDKQDEDFLKNDLGGSLIAKNISDYISGSVFHDGVFIKINNRYVWIDFFDWF